MHGQRKHANKSTLTLLSFQNFGMQEMPALLSLSHIGIQQTLLMGHEKMPKKPTHSWVETIQT